MRRAPGVAALGVCLCLLAAAFGVRALYVPGVALVALALGAQALVGLAAWRVRVAREPRFASVEEEQPLRLTLHVRAPALPFGGGELRRWPGGPSQRLGRSRRGAIEFAVRSPRRGKHLLGPSLVRFSDPFGICTRCLQSAPCELLVLPRLERVSGEHLLRVAGRARAGRSRPAGGAGSDVDGLRPYRQGAPASLIHWPTVARTGVLLERQLRDEEEEGLPLIALDARDPAGGDALDKAVRAAASLCVGLARLGGCSLLLPGLERAERVGRDLAAFPALHARMALLEPGAALAWGPLERAASVILITAEGVSRSLPARAARADFVVSPFALPRRPVLFSVAGCAVQAGPVAAAARGAA